MTERSFESALRRLEEIVEELERGDIPLEESLKIYEEGMELIRFCNERLNKAEKRLLKLVKKEDGSFQLELMS